MKSMPVRAGLGARGTNWTLYEKIEPWNAREHEEVFCVCWPHEPHLPQPQQAQPKPAQLLGLAWITTELFLPAPTLHSSFSQAPLLTPCQAVSGTQHCWNPQGPRVGSWESPKCHQPPWCPEGHCVTGKTRFIYPIFILCPRQRVGWCWFSHLGGSWCRFWYGTLRAKIWGATPPAISDVSGCEQI